MTKQIKDMGLLCLWLLLCSAPLLVHYEKSGPCRVMENLCVMSSQETWMRQQAGEAGAWVLPSWNGRPRVNKPPMLVWLNMLAWSGLEPETSSVDELIGRSRLLAVGMSLLTLGAIFGLGCFLSGSRMGRLAMVLTGCSFFFIKQGRLATYDTHWLAWISWSVLVGCWALRLSRARGVRRGLPLWIWSGLLFGGALLTKGALASLFVLVPLLVFGLQQGGRRRNLLVGISVCVLVGGICFGAWYGYIFLRQPHAWEYLLREYRFPMQAKAKPLWYYAGFLALIFPWTFWLIPALLQPVKRWRKTGETGSLIPWLWFVTVLVIMSISPSKSQRYIAPLLVPCGLLLAIYFLQFYAQDQLSRRVYKVLAGVYWLVLGGVSLGLPVLVMPQPYIERLSWMSALPVLPGISMGFACGLLVILLALWAWGFRWFRQGKMVQSVYCVALLSLFASSMGYYAYAVSPDNGAFPFRTQAEAVQRLNQEAPLYYLSFVPDADRIDPFSLPKPDRDPDKEFLIYYRGIIPGITLEEVRQKIRMGDVFRVCVRDAAGRPEMLSELGVEPVFRFKDGGGPAWLVFAAFNTQR